MKVDLAPKKKGRLGLARSAKRKLDFVRAVCSVSRKSVKVKRNESPDMFDDTQIILDDSDENE